MKNDDKRDGRRTQKIVLLAVILAVVCAALAVCLNSPSFQARKQQDPGQSQEAVNSVSGASDREEPEKAEMLTAQAVSESGSDEEKVSDTAAESTAETAAGTTAETAESTSNPADTGEAEDPEAVRPYADFATDYTFSSGAGGWSTTLTLYPDGSIEGSYHDRDMGDTGDGYPYGTEYISNFTGRFSAPVQEDEHTWSMTMDTLNVEGTGEDFYIEDGIRYIYSNPVGLDRSENFHLYTPGKNLSDFDDTIQMYLYGYTGTNDSDVLPYYCIENVSQEAGQR